MQVALGQITQLKSYFWPTQVSRWDAKKLSYRKSYMKVQVCFKWNVSDLSIFTVYIYTYIQYIYIQCVYIYTYITYIHIYITHICYIYITYIQFNILEIHILFEEVDILFYLRFHRYLVMPREEADRALMHWIFFLKCESHIWNRLGPVLMRNTIRKVKEAPYGHLAPVLDLLISKHLMWIQPVQHHF